MNALKLPPFKDTKLIHIKEYISVLQPVAEVLDRLQGEENSFYGDLRPTLLTTNVKLSQLEEDARLRHCMLLVHAAVNLEVYSITFYPYIHWWLMH